MGKPLRFRAKVDGLSEEQIALLRKDAIFDRDHVGAPGCLVRQKAEWLIKILDCVEAGDAS